MPQNPEVTIIKPGIFNGLTGYIIVTNKSPGTLPLKIDLAPYGTWSFDYADIEGGIKKQKAPIEAKKVDILPFETELKRTKRKYTKKKITIKKAKK